MTRLSVGAFQATVLIGGTVMLLLLGFLFGVVVIGLSSRMTAPTVPAQMAAALPPQAQGALPPQAQGALAPAGAAPAAGGKPSASGPTAQPKGLEGYYQRQASKQSLIYSDKAADQTIDTVGEATGPAAGAAVRGVSGALPPFMAKYVPWVTNFAGYQVRSRSKDAVQDVVQGQMRSAAGLDGQAPAPGAPGAATAGAGTAGAGTPGAATAANAAGQTAAPGTVAPSAAAAAGGGPMAFALPQPNPLVPRGLWTIEFGRFATADNADSFAADLSQRGLDTTVTIERQPDGHAWHVVRSGSYASDLAASQALQHLQAQGFGGTVVPLGNG